MEVSGFGAGERTAIGAAARAARGRCRPRGLRGFSSRGTTGGGPRGAAAPASEVGEVWKRALTGDFEEKEGSTPNSPREVRFKDSSRRRRDVRLVACLRRRVGDIATAACLVMEPAAEVAVASELSSTLAAKTRRHRQLRQWRRQRPLLLLLLRAKETILLTTPKRFWRSRSPHGGS